MWMNKDSSSLRHCDFSIDQISNRPSYDKEMAIATRFSVVDVDNSWVSKFFGFCLSL